MKHKHKVKKRIVKRTLWDCSNAKVWGDRVHCKAGQVLGIVTIEKVARGAPLALSVCQKCEHYDNNGPPLPKEERGWLREQYIKMGGR